MKKAASLLLFLLAAAAQPALAREKPYAGFDYTSATFSTASVEPEYTALRFRAGTEFSKYLGVEYQGAIGVARHSAVVTGGSIESGLSSLVGLYLRPKLALGENVAVYALGGYAWSWIELDVKIPGRYSRTEGRNDFSAGGGAEFRVLGDNFLSLDYMQYTEGLTAVSAGVRIPF